MISGKCEFCGSDHAVNVSHDDGHMVKMSIDCVGCGENFAEVIGIRNAKNPKKSSCCMKFANDSFYCGPIAI